MVVLKVLHETRITQILHLLHNVKVNVYLFIWKKALYDRLRTIAAKWMRPHLIYRKSLLRRHL